MPILPTLCPALATRRALTTPPTGTPLFSPARTTFHPTTPALAPFPRTLSPLSGLGPAPAPGLMCASVTPLFPLPLLNATSARPGPLSRPLACRPRCLWRCRPGRARHRFVGPPCTRSRTNRPAWDALDADASAASRRVRQRCRPPPLSTLASPHFGPDPHAATHPVTGQAGPGHARVHVVMTRPRSPLTRPYNAAPLSGRRRT